MQKFQIAASRILLAMVFLGLVLLKIKAMSAVPGGYIQYKVALGEIGLASSFAPFLIGIQLIGGLALLLGFKTKFFARLLAILAVFFAVVLSQLLLDSLFLYFGIAGGMWLVSIYPEMPYSLDNYFNKN